jgi:hypothetical protein
MLHYSTYTEKRSFPRFSVLVPILYSTQDCDLTIYANTRDISVEGVCMVTERELPCGTCMDVYLKMLDTGEQVHRRGRVVWSGRFGDNKFRAGIKLDDLHLKPVDIVLRTIKAQRKY